MFPAAGGYYLTSVYAGLCLIQSLDGDQPVSGCLTPQAQEALKEWSCRRSREAQRQQDDQQSQVGLLFVIVAAQRRHTGGVAACVGLHADLL